MSDSEVFDEIVGLFRDGGGGLYFGEDITQLEHALQTAHQARMSKAGDALVLASLLHDLGHLLHVGGETLGERRIDGRHELLGATWLRTRFPVEVSEPVRLHVAAKRYRCSVDDGYRLRLSAESTRSLGLQGGPMDSFESRAFENESAFDAAMSLRAWDDAAKVVGLSVPGLDHHRECIQTLARRKTV